MVCEVDVAIVGAGTAGLNVMSQVRKAGKSFVLINGGPLGTTCARVGCMPSKAFIQVGEDFYRRNLFERHAIEGKDALTLNMEDALEHVRHLRDIFVDRVLAKTTDNMGAEFIDGYAEFREPNVLQVNEEIVRARRIVLACGSTPVIPPPWASLGERLLTSDNIFEQESLPESVAVIGLGIIGLELGQALHRYGVQVTGIDQISTLAHLSDPVVNQEAVGLMDKEFPLWLGQRAEIEPSGEKLRVSAGEQEVLVDKALVCIGRRPNLAGLGLDKVGARLNALGVPAYNAQTMQVDDLPIFMAGDVVADRPVLHEASDEGKIAGYNASRDQPTAFRRKTPLAITFCDPNIATLGASWKALENRADVVVGEMRFGPVGRALIMAKNKGVLRIYAEKRGGKLLGAAMIAPKGENLAHLLAWSIEQGLTVFDLLRMPYYHPVIEEALQAALYDVLPKLEDRPLDDQPGGLLELSQSNEN